jgi:hypothetical protein
MSILPGVPLPIPLDYHCPGLIAVPCFQSISSLMFFMSLVRSHEPNEGQLSMGVAMAILPVPMSLLRVSHFPTSHSLRRLPSCHTPAASLVQSASTSSTSSVNVHSLAVLFEPRLRRKFREIHNLRCGMDLATHLSRISASTMRTPVCCFETIFVDVQREVRFRSLFCCARLSA